MHVLLLLNGVLYMSIERALSNNNRTCNLLINFSPPGPSLQSRWQRNLSFQEKVTYNLNSDLRGWTWIELEEAGQLFQVLMHDCKNLEWFPDDIYLIFFFKTVQEHFVFGSSGQ